MKINFVFFVIVFLITTIASAQIQSLRKWHKLQIPNAICGDGSPYHVFMSEGSSTKLAFYFMGGGACWDNSSCQGQNPRTILFPIPQPPEVDGFVSSNLILSPVADYSMVYLPYCTGDVHLGNHNAKYENKIVHHQGFKNFELTLQLLDTKKIIELSNIKELVVYGYSAGAIGALIHTSTIDKYIPQTEKRILISDSPGLHFGPNFWHKFTPALIQDYSTAMARVGIQLNINDGFIAKYLDRVCRQLNNWQIGFLQSSRDLVMSRIFGEIYQTEHEKLVFGANGLYQNAKKPNDNCSAWIPHSESHTFLVTSTTASAEKSENKTALEFTNELILNSIIK